MAKIEYVSPDGTSTTVAAEPGTTLMENAVAHNVAGILAECGGQAACGTCHIRVPTESADLFDAPAELETDMLEYTDGVTDESRLSCQLRVSEECDGLVVEVADPGL